jgi:glycosyltransferase involved in cell wall biosynthesis
MAMKPRVFILIPALNEADQIQTVIQAIPEGIAREIVVIDDASIDDTASIARSTGAAVLPLAVRLGAWGAIRTGLRYANRRGADMVVTMDADGQHPPEFLAKLLDPLRLGRADVTIGSCTDRGSAARKWAWRFFRRITGLEIQDLTSGFRAYNRPAVSAMLSMDTALLDYQDIGVLLTLRRQGLRVTEVPVPMRPRESGHSRVFSNWWAVLRYLVTTFLLCLSRSGQSGKAARKAE